MGHEGYEESESERRVKVKGRKEPFMGFEVLKGLAFQTWLFPAFKCFAP
jgi:hypothetical protein